MMNSHDKQQVLYMFRSENMSAEAIAKALGYSTSTIEKVIKPPAAQKQVFTSRVVVRRPLGEKQVFQSSTLNPLDYLDTQKAKAQLDKERIERIKQKVKEEIQDYVPDPSLTKMQNAAKKAWITMRRKERLKEILAKEDEKKRLLKEANYNLEKTRAVLR